MDHGGRDTLIMDNEVRACDFGLAFTGPGQDCLSINNENHDSPRSAHWNVARPNVSIIGNRFTQASFLSLGGENLVLTDNVVREAIGTRRAVLASYAPVTAYEARNDWGTLTEWDERGSVVWLSGAPPPPAPMALDAYRCGDTVVLGWTYERAPNHDAFAIQHSPDGTTWSTIAFRPPHDGRWDFDTDLHPEWVPFDPLVYTDRDHSSGFYRIRAQYRDAVSPWSPAVEVR